MNVEAEILGLQLRMQALEAQPCPGSVITAIGAAVVVMTAEVTEARFESIKTLSALAADVEDLRRRTNEHLQRDKPTWYDTLQNDLNALRLKLDRLLEKDGA
ncbi:hypothetical protein [Nonomuraea sp. 10N515B]|uniref:hypothetical protein n=1 Tax=Nonomuraea sp. 10N515B TaxID=3457422 RepID=UPI003FCEC58A